MCFNLYQIILLTLTFNKKNIVFYLVCLLNTINLKCILQKEPEKVWHPCQTSNTCFKIKHQQC